MKAQDAVISIVLKVNGKAVSGEAEPQPQDAPIVLSPAVPHPLFRHITADTYRDVVQGKTNLVVETRVCYRGPRGDEHCYMMRDSYDHMDRVFYPRGGSLSCDLRPIMFRPADLSGPARVHRRVLRRIRLPTHIGRSTSS